MVEHYEDDDRTSFTLEWVCHSAYPSLSPLTTDYIISFSQLLSSEEGISGRVNLTWLKSTGKVSGRFMYHLILQSAHMTPGSTVPYSNDSALRKAALRCQLSSFSGGKVV